MKLNWLAHPHFLLCGPVPQTSTYSSPRGWEPLKSESVNHSSCPTLLNSMNCSLPGSSVYGILLAGILEWVTIPFSRGSSQPKDWTQVSCFASTFFTIWATREASGNPWNMPLCLFLNGIMPYMLVCDSLPSLVKYLLEVFYISRYTVTFLCSCILFIM